MRSLGVFGLQLDRFSLATDLLVGFGRARVGFDVALVEARHSAGAVDLADFGSCCCGSWCSVLVH